MHVPSSVSISVGFWANAEADLQKACLQLGKGKRADRKAKRVSWLTEAYVLYTLAKCRVLRQRYREAAASLAEAEKAPGSDEDYVAADIKELRAEIERELQVRSFARVFMMAVNHLLTPGCLALQLESDKANAELTAMMDSSDAEMEKGQKKKEKRKKQQQRQKLRGQEQNEDRQDAHEQDATNEHDEPSDKEVPTVDTGGTAAAGGADTGALPPTAATNAQNKKKQKRKKKKNKKKKQTAKQQQVQKFIESVGLAKYCDMLINTEARPEHNHSNKISGLTFFTHLQYACAQEMDLESLGLCEVADFEELGMTPTDSDLLFEALKGLSSVRDLRYTYSTCEVAQSEVSCPQKDPIENYCNTIVTPGIYGGELECKALAEMLGAHRFFVAA